MVAQQFIEQDLPKQKILTWCWVARSNFTISQLLE